jgi:hypothetical protein
MGMPPTRRIDFLTDDILHLLHSLLKGLVERAFKDYNVKLPWLDY